MKYLIFLVVMLPAIARAQQSPSCMKLDKGMIVPHVLQQKGATMVFLAFKTHSCYVLQNEPAVISFQAPSGLEVLVNGTRFSAIDQSSVGTPAERAKQMIVFLKIAASPDLPLGKQTLHAVMSYNITDKSGNVSSETLTFEVPFKVVPPGNPKHHSKFTNGLILTGIIIVTLPLLPFLYVLCLLTDGCG